ncbi:YhdT family protein [Bacillus kwashiorkori]|uniref:YhdT family protein n=1 Tax=Bacillus kwashiorkori TaxID=1522318 RepID=UPI0007857C26|nr:YhdT family protein [Bacillus kwashiorkori]
MKEDPMFSKDPRFKIAKKEALIGVGLAIFNFLWWYGFAYGLGSRSPEQYRYILGFPDWFFYSCIGGLGVMSILVIFAIKKFFKEVPFEEVSEEEQS